MVYFVCSDLLCYLLLVCQSSLLLIHKGGTIFYTLLSSAFIMVLLLSVLQKCRLFVNICYKILLCSKSINK